LTEKYIFEIMIAQTIRKVIYAHNMVGRLYRLP